MKILGIEGNYPGAQAPFAVFSKCDSALIKEGKPFFIPDFTTHCQFAVHLVVHLCRMGREIAPRFAHRYYDAVTLGIDFTAADMLDAARANGLPWEMAKGFDNSAVIGTMVDITAHTADGSHTLPHMDFRLDVDGNTVQQGNTRDMIHDIDHLVAHISQYCMLRQGDLIFTGTPQLPIDATINQHLTGYINDHKVIEFNIK